MTVQAIPQVVPLTPDAAAPQWVMLARTGAWLGHPTTPEVITPDRLRSARDYFDRHYAATGTDLVVDYHHSSVTAPCRAQLAPAAGWVTAVELRNGDTELWGRVLWTAEAADAIARRRFRYVSPALRFGAPDRVTGERVPMMIHSVGLTNTPFLTELESLNEAAADGGATLTEGGEPMGLLNAIAEALGREPEHVASALGLDPAGDDRQVAEAVLACAERRRVPEFVANSLGVCADADETAVRAALIRLKAPGAGLTSVRARLGLPDAAPECDVLNAIDALQAAGRDGQAEQLVDAAVAEGKIPPAHRDFYLNEARSDLDAAREVINSLPVLTAPQPAPRKTLSRRLSDAEESVRRQLGLSAEAFLNAE